MPGEFDLYGYRFRWSEGEGAGEGCNQDPIALIRMHQPFPSDGVDWLSESKGYIPAYGKMGKCLAYRFDGVAAFVFPPDGRYLQMYIEPEADQCTFEFVLFRGVLPRLLHLHGTTSLHASAVAVGDGAVVFCGPSGAGKSTLAAALVSRGLPLVSDDVVPIRTGRPGDAVMAGPGLPELRLYPNTAERLGITDRVIAPIRGQAKGRWQPGRAPESPLPLVGIYVLDPALHGTSPLPASLQPLPAPEALIMLIRNSYWVHPSETAALGKDLLCLGNLLRSVPVQRLTYELSETGIAAVDELITSAVAVGAR